MASALTTTIDSNPSISLYFVTDHEVTMYEDSRSRTANGPIYAGYRFRLRLPATSVVVLMIFAFPAFSFGAWTNAGPDFTVLVFNFKQVPFDILAEAESAAGGIFGRAGVHVAWRDCSTGTEPCRKGPGRVFFLAMTAGPVQIKVTDTVSGYAVLRDHLADGHSIAGIMQPHWGVEQTRLALMSRLFFLPEEARLMHAGTAAAPQAKDNSASALTSHQQRRKWRIPSSGGETSTQRANVIERNN
jgi:hypothetical protein